MCTRFVAIGDSFTEGVGDDDSSHPNGLRGWADRVAEQLAEGRPGLGYANLAIRGRLLPSVLTQQLEPAVSLRPDLVTLYAGGNDLMRPRVDIDHARAAPDIGPRIPVRAHDQRRENLRWAREYATPWVKRRLRGESSGDSVSPKRPTLSPVEQRHTRP